MPRAGTFCGGVYRQKVCFGLMLDELTALEYLPAEKRELAFV